MAPYAAGWFLVFFQAVHSDRTKVRDAHCSWMEVLKRSQDRGYHIMGSCFTSFVGYLILATAVQKSVGAAYFALFLVIGGNYSLFPLVM